MQDALAAVQYDAASSPTHLVESTSLARSRRGGERGVVQADTPLGAWLLARAGVRPSPLAHTAFPPRESIEMTLERLACELATISSLRPPALSDVQLHLVRRTFAAMGRVNSTTNGAAAAGTAETDVGSGTATAASCSVAGAGSRSAGSAVTSTSTGTSTGAGTGTGASSNSRGSSTGSAASAQTSSAAALAAHATQTASAAIDSSTPTAACAAAGGAATNTSARAAAAVAGAQGTLATELDALPLNAQIGIRLFLRLLGSMQHRGRSGSRSMSKLIRQLPRLLAELPPLALVDAVSPPPSTAQTSENLASGCDRSSGVEPTAQRAAPASDAPTTPAAGVSDGAIGISVGDGTDAGTDRDLDVDLNTAGGSGNETSTGPQTCPAPPTVASTMVAQPETPVSVADALAEVLQRALDCGGAKMRGVDAKGRAAAGVEREALQPLHVDDREQLQLHHEAVTQTPTAVAASVSASATDGAREQNAALAGLVGLAVKRGRLPRILRAVALLLQRAEEQARTQSEAMAKCNDGGRRVPRIRKKHRHLPCARYWLRELVEARAHTEDPLPGRRRRGGRLMTFGKGDHGKLGHGFCANPDCAHGHCTENKLLPTPLSALPERVHIVDSLSTHSVAVNEHGELFSWGNGDKHRLGHGTVAKEYVPRRMMALADQAPVHDVACGLGHTLALLADGQVFAWGNGGNGRLGLGDTGDRATACAVAALHGVGVSAIFSGASHSLALTKSGAAYSWGKNNQGQCGHGHTQDQLVPQWIEGLQDESICQMAGGWEHTLLLSAGGKVYSCGSGYKDSRRAGLPPVLGHGSTERQLMPRLVLALADETEPCSHVACGWDHSLAVARSGALYSWGSGTNGKLGHGDDDNRVLPTRIEALVAAGAHIVQAEAGCEHSCAITSQGELYSWGHGDSGRLGHGNNKSESKPKLVEHLVWQGLRAVRVAVGDKYNMLLVKGLDADTDGGANDDADEDLADIMGAASVVEGELTRPNCVVPPSSATRQAQQKATTQALPDEPQANTAHENSQTILSTAWLLEHPALSITDAAMDEALPHSLTAVHILLHLDRLASTYSPKRDGKNGSFQSLQISGRDAGMASHNITVFKPYCIDTSAETFEAIRALLHDNLSDSPPLYPATGSKLSPPFLRWCIVRTCLRLLKANLYQLLLARGTSSTGVIGSDDTEANKLQTTLQSLHALLYRIVNRPTEFFNAGTGDSDADDAFLKSLREANLDLTHTWQNLQVEAAAVLRVGFEHFYPTPVARRKLLLQLIHTPQPQQLLLVTLVDRLAQEQAVFDLLTHVFGTGTSTKVQAEHPISPDAFNILLSDILSRSAADVENRIASWHTDSLNRGAEQPMLPYLQLLLALQKHLLADWWLDQRSKESVTTNTGNATRSSARHTTAMSREGVKASLLGHSERLFERAADVLQRMVDILTETPTVDTDKLICIMNQSFVMVLMPLLLSSLAIAPRHNEFNVILTPSLMRLLRVLDSLNICLRDKHTGTSSIANFLDLECSMGLLLGVFLRRFVVIDDSDVSAHAEATLQPWLQSAILCGGLRESPVVAVEPDSSAGTACGSDDGAISEGEVRRSEAAVAQMLGWQSAGVYEVEPEPTSPSKSGKAAKRLQSLVTPLFSPSQPHKQVPTPTFRTGSESTPACDATLTAFMRDLFADTGFAKQWADRLDALTVEHSAFLDSDSQSPQKSALLKQTHRAMVVALLWCNGMAPEALRRAGCVSDEELVDEGIEVESFAPEKMLALWRTAHVGCTSLARADTDCAVCQVVIQNCAFLTEVNPTYPIELLGQAADSGSHPFALPDTSFDTISMASFFTFLQTEVSLHNLRRALKQRSLRAVIRVVGYDVTCAALKAVKFAPVQEQIIRHIFSYTCAWRASIGTSDGDLVGVSKVVGATDSLDVDARRATETKDALLGTPSSMHCMRGMDGCGFGMARQVHRAFLRLYTRLASLMRDGSSANVQLSVLVACSRTIQAMTVPSMEGGPQATAGCMWEAAVLEVCPMFQASSFLTKIDVVTIVGHLLATNADILTERVGEQDMVHSSNRGTTITHTCSDPRNATVPTKFVVERAILHHMSWRFLHLVSATQLSGESACVQKQTSEKLACQLHDVLFAELSRVLNAIEALKSAEARVNDILRTSGAHPMCGGPPIILTLNTGRRVPGVPRQPIRWGFTLSFRLWLSSSMATMPPVSDGKNAMDGLGAGVESAADSRTRTSTVLSVHGHRPTGVGGSKATGAGLAFYIHFNEQTKKMSLTCTFSTMRDGGIEVEKIDGQGEIPVEQWMHVACVYDGQGKSMHVFIDGVLAGKSSCNVHPPENVLHTIALGHSSHHPPVLHPTNSECVLGIDGSIADLCWHRQALSVNSICSILAEPLTVCRTRRQLETEDYAFRLMSLVHVFSSTPGGISILSSEKWAVLLFTLLRVSHTRVQRCILYLLRRVLPHFKPKSLTVPCFATSSRGTKGATKTTSAASFLFAMFGQEWWDVLQRTNRNVTRSKEATSDGGPSSLFDSLSFSQHMDHSSRGSLNRVPLTGDIVTLFRHLSSIAPWSTYLETTFSRTFGALRSVNTSDFVQRLPSLQESSRWVGDVPPVLSCVPSDVSTALLAIYVLGGNLDRLGANSRVQKRLDTRQQYPPAFVAQGYVVQGTPSSAMWEVDFSQAVAEHGPGVLAGSDIEGTAPQGLVAVPRSQLRVVPEVAPLAPSPALLSAFWPSLQYLLDHAPRVTRDPNSVTQSVPESQRNDSFVDDHMVAFARARARAIRALTHMLRFKSTCSHAALNDEVFKRLLAVATTNVASVPAQLVGQDPQVAPASPPAVQKLTDAFSEPLNLPALEELSAALWSRIHSTSCSSYWWQMRQRQQLHCLGGEVQISGSQVCGVSNFPSVRLGASTLGVAKAEADAPDESKSDSSTEPPLISSGSWYYEAVLLSSGLMQIGWVDELFVSDPVNGQGVGDHAHSWAFDGFRQKKWNGNASDYGERWEAGDVVGCLLDLDAHEIRFSLNGKDLGAAFVGIDFSAAGLRIAPAASFNADQAIRFNFGHSPFTFPPELDDAQPSIRPVCEAIATSSKQLTGSLDSMRGDGVPSELDANGGACGQESGESANAAGGAAVAASIDADSDNEGNAHDSGADVEADAEHQTEIRRQALIENLIGMGFSVDWAMRASEFDDALTNESVAVAWIIEQMELESAKADEDNGTSRRRGSNQQNGGGMSGEDRERGEREQRDDSNGVSAAPMSLALANAGRRVGTAFEHGSQPVDELDCEDLNAEVYFHSQPATVLEAKSETSSMQLVAMADSASDDEVWVLCGSCDTALAVLYARQALAALFEHFQREHVGAVPRAPSHATTPAVAPLLTTFADARSRAMLVAALKLLWHGHRAAPAMRSLNAAGGGALLSVLGVLCNSTECNTRGKKDSKRWGRGKRHGATREGLEAMLVAEAVSHFTRARAPDFEHIVWGTGARAALDFGISDEDALSRPFVEWAAWLLEALLTVDAQRNERFRANVGAAPTDVTRNQQLCCVDATAFATLVQAAFAGNMALKHFAFRILARVLCVVRERLLILAMHRMQQKQRAEIAGKHAAQVSGSTVFTTLEGSSASSAALEYLSSLQDYLLVNLFTNRHRKEKSTRVTYSVYLQSIFALLVSSRRLRAVVQADPSAKTFDSPAASNCVQDVAEGPSAPDICDDLFPWLHLDGASSSSQLPTLTVEEATVSSVTLSWDGLGDLSPALQSPGAQSDLGDAAEPQLDLSVDGSLDGSLSASFRVANAAGAGADACNDEAVSTGTALGTMVNTGTGGGECSDADRSPRRVILEMRTGAQREYVPVDSGGVDFPMPFTHTVEQLEADTAYVFRLRQCEVGGTVSRPIRVHTPAELLFMLDPEHVGPNLEISNGNVTVTNRVNKKWNAVRATVGFSTGVHAWRVHINKCISKNIFIGVMEQHAALDNYVGADRYGWGYLANKAIWHNKGKVRSYGELFKEGDVVEARLDMDAGTLAFTRNGRDLGVAVDGLVGEMFPAFSMYNKDDQLSLMLADSMSTKSVGGGAVAEQLCARACLALDVMSTAADQPQDTQEGQVADQTHEPNPDRRHGSLQLSERFLRCAYRHLRLWRSRSIVRHSFSGGNIIDVDTSVAACTPFGFGAGSTVLWTSTSSISASVLGVCNHCLWVLPKGSDDAVPCSLRACREMQLQDATASGRLLRTRAGSGRGARLGSPDDVHVECGRDGHVTFQQFVAWMRADDATPSGPWTLEHDRQIVRYLSGLSASRRQGGSTVWSLAWEDVPEIDGLAYPALRDVPAPRLRCRVAVLRLLNDLLRPPLLPLLELYNQEPHVQQPHRRTPSPRHRELLFADDKCNFLGRVLRQSLALSKAAHASSCQDKGKDTSSTLPVLTIKLPVHGGAATLDVGSDAGSDVASTGASGDSATLAAYHTSALGQVCEQLRALALKDLRTAPLRVKVARGPTAAGADDGSIACRQLLSCICAELSAASRRPHGVDVVGLLCECGGATTESTHSAGSYRRAMDERSRQVAMQSAYFLGQLMGLVLRANEPLALPLPRVVWRMLRDMDAADDDGDKDYAADGCGRSAGGASDGVAAVRSLHDGLSTIVPPHSLKLFTEVELEGLFRGSLEVPRVSHRNNRNNDDAK